MSCTKFAAEMSLPNGDDTYSDLIEEVNKLQDDALTKHENYVNNTSTLHGFDARIKELCKEIKKLKAHNAERTGVMERITSQNSDLKKLTAKEESITAAVEEQKKKIDMEIVATKNMYLEKLRDHELFMAATSSKLTSAPHDYGIGKMNIEMENLNLQKLEVASKNEAEVDEEKLKIEAELFKVEKEREAAEEIAKMLDGGALNDYIATLEKQISTTEQEIEANESLKADLKKQVDENVL